MVIMMMITMRLLGQVFLVILVIVSGDDDVILRLGCAMLDERKLW